jgi:uncharacterized membrane protein YiaA
MSMPHAILLSTMFAVVAVMWIAAAHLNSFGLYFAALVAGAIWAKVAEFIFDK